MPEKGS